MYVCKEMMIILLPKCLAQMDKEKGDIIMARTMGWDKNM